MCELKAAGDTVLGVCRRDSPAVTFLRQNDIRTIHLPDNRKLSIRSIRYLHTLMERESVDVAHVHYHRDIWNASLALRSDRGKKLFLSVYMGVSGKNDFLHRYVYRRVDGLFTSSHELKRRLPALYPVPASKVHFVPYGRNLEKYRLDESVRREIRKKYGVRDDELLVGTMVRIDPGKGVMDFIRSIPLLPPEIRSRTKFIVVGEPTRKGTVRPGESPYEEHCMRYLGEIRRYLSDHSLEGTVILAGFQEDFIGYLSAMDIFVFPSRDELYSLVVLDAMCMKLPVVAAGAGGTLDQIRDGTTGLFYGVGDSNDCAVKISRYCQAPSLRREHGSAARSFVEQNHSMARMISKLQEYYRS